MTSRTVTLRLDTPLTYARSHRIVQATLHQNLKTDPHFTDTRRYPL